MFIPSIPRSEGKWIMRKECVLVSLLSRPLHTTETDSTEGKARGPAWHVLQKIKEKLLPLFYVLWLFVARVSLLLNAPSRAKPTSCYLITADSSCVHSVHHDRETVELAPSWPIKNLHTRTSTTMIRVSVNLVFTTVIIITEIQSSIVAWEESLVYVQ